MLTSMRSILWLFLFPGFIYTTLTNSSTVSRISGGKTASRKLIKTFTHLFIQFKDGSTSACSGNLVHENYVLTSVHCLLHRQKRSPPSYIGVSVGLRRPSDMQSNRKAESIYFLKSLDFHGRSFAPDIAIIKLDAESIWRRAYTPAITLSHSLPRHMTGHENIVAVGSGVCGGTIISPSEIVNPCLPKFVKEIELTHRSNEFCLSKSSSEMQELVSDEKGRWICFLNRKYPFDTSCDGPRQGDSGGPIYVKYRERLRTRYVQIGVISRGWFGVGTTSTITFATDVSSFFSQIQEVLKGNGMNSWLKYDVSC